MTTHHPHRRRRRPVNTTTTASQPLKHRLRAWFDAAAKIFRLARWAHAAWPHLAPCLHHLAVAALAWLR